ncbi:unnamed protein product [Brassica oleracea]
MLSVGETEHPGFQIEWPIKDACMPSCERDLAEEHARVSLLSNHSTLIRNSFMSEANKVRSIVDLRLY